MNQRNSLTTVLVCCFGLVMAATSHAQVETTSPSPDSLTDSPIGLNVPLRSGGSSAQTQGPETQPKVSPAPPQAESSEKATVIPPLDPESIPLPRTNTAAATATGGGNGNTSGTAWWNGPEAKVIGFLVLLIIGAWVVGRVGQRGGRVSRISGGSRPSGVVQVLARFPMGRGTQLVLLECGQRILLLEQQKGRTNTGLQTLTEFTTREDVAELRTRLEASNRSSDESFQKDLERSIGMYANNGAPVKFTGSPVSDADLMETVDLTRRRPRRAARGPE